MRRARWPNSSVLCVVALRDPYYNQSPITRTSPESNCERFISSFLNQAENGIAQQESTPGHFE